MTPKDAFITRISDKVSHPNADKLEVVYVGNWQCVVPKDKFNIGDIVLYIVPDATLSKDKLWSKSYLKYLGSGNRVKSISLRKMMSNGIVISIDDELLQQEFKANGLEDNYENLSSETICDILGIGHYSPPVPTDLSVKTCSLPYGIEKSDEENFQSLKEKNLHLGETVLVTKKMDGSSALIYYNPNTDNLQICSRTMSLKLDCNNNYINALSPYIDTIKFVAEYFNTPVAIRGEVCGNNINKSKCNKDALLPLGFYMYGTRFPELGKDYTENDRMGRYGTDFHFLKINQLIKDHNMLSFNTVPILGEEVVTIEMLNKYKNMPKDFGEGVVLNGYSFSYKAKSDDYYASV